MKLTTGRVSTDDSQIAHAIVCALAAENKRLQRRAQKVVKDLRAAGNHEQAENKGNTFAGVYRP